MRMVCGENGDPVSVELTSDEMRELLAFETNYIQLVPRKSSELLKATMEAYHITDREMAPYLESPVLSRDDVWNLQLMKRRSQNKEQAIEILNKLRSTEAYFGVQLLQLFSRAISGCTSPARVQFIGS